MTDNPTIATHRWSSHRPEDRFTVENPATGRTITVVQGGGVTRDMRIATEEIFGPAVTVTAFNTEDKAVAIANEPDYDLLAGIYTRDSERSFRAGGSKSAWH
jgi:acyl-CoA reductase-like NAD-dependent aldehyde dehydrogenase